MNRRQFLAGAAAAPLAPMAGAHKPYATGGIVIGGAHAIIGERGPEFIISTSMDGVISREKAREVARRSILAVSARSQL